MSVESTYEPTHPLPAEIVEMADETVCKFCGVSYLIHNEIKELKKQLQAYKSEIDRLKKFDSREALLKEEIRQLQLQSEDLLLKFENVKKRDEEYNRQLEEKTEKFNVQTKELRQLEQHFQMKESEITNLKCVIDKFKRHLDGIHAQFQDIKNYLSDTHNFVKELMLTYGENMKDYSMKINKNISKITEVELERKLEERRQFEEQSQETKKKHMLEKDKFLQIINEFKKKKKEEEAKHEESISNLKCKNDKVDKDNAKLLEQLSATKNSFSAELQYAHETIKNLKSEQQNSKESIQSMRDEQVNRQRSNQQLLRETQRCLNEENKKLNLERDEMIKAHQQRIADLRESYNQKLLDQNHMQNKFEGELTKKEKEWEDEKRKMVKNIMNEENKKLAEAEEKQKILLEKLNGQYKQREYKLKSQLEKLQETFQSEIKKSQNEVKKSQKDSQQLANELTRLKEDLQRSENERAQTLAQLQSLQHGVVDERRMADVKRLLKGTQHDLTEQRDRNLALESDIEMLRECVSKECSERFELTEALAQARSELLQHQRFKNVSTTSKTHLTPSPPAGYLKSSPVNRLKSSSFEEGKIKTRTSSEPSRTRQRNLSEVEKFKRSLKNSLSR